jgi:hypothetical protein
MTHLLDLGGIGSPGRGGGKSGKGVERIFKDVNFSHSIDFFLS